MSGANGRSSLDGANPDDQPIEAPWAKTGVLTRDLTAGGIVYLEMPLAALERGLDLIRQVRSRLPQVSVPVLLIYGDRDAIVEKANGP